MNKLLTYIEKYGLLFVLLNCFALLLPDLSQKTNMMGLDVEVFNASQSGSSIKKQVFWLLPLVLYILSFIRLKYSFSLKVSVRKLMVPIGLVIMVLVLSFLINGNALMLKRIIFQLILLFVVFAAVFFSIKELSTAICINYLVLVIIVVCCTSLALGTGYSGGSFNAWATTKNSLGSYLLGAGLLLWYAKNFLPENIHYYKIKLTCLLVFLFFTVSKTAVLLTFIFVILNFRRLQQLVPAVLTVVTLLLVSLFIVMPGIAAIFSTNWHIALYMEPSTLTGRGLIWGVLYYDLFHYNKLWLGYGYASYFATGIVPSTLDDAYSFMRLLSSAHNGYLELILQFGVVLSGMLVFLIYKLVLITKDFGVYSISIIVFLHNITESSFLRDQHIMWVILIMVMFLGLLKTQGSLASIARGKG